MRRRLRRCGREHVTVWKEAMTDSIGEQRLAHVFRRRNHSVRTRHACQATVNRHAAEAILCPACEPAEVQRANIGIVGKIELVIGRPTDWRKAGVGNCLKLIERDVEFNSPIVCNENEC